MSFVNLFTSFADPSCELFHNIVTDFTTEDFTPM